MIEILTITTGILFLVHASGKLFRAPLAVATGQTFGYSRFVLPLGIIETTLGIALIAVALGYLPSVVALVATLWFVVSMGAATAHHLLLRGVSDGWRAALVPAIFTLVGAATIVVWL